MPKPRKSIPKKRHTCEAVVERLFLNPNIPIGCVSIGLIDYFKVGDRVRVTVERIRGGKR